jgi:hypothetical protein
MPNNQIIIPLPKTTKFPQPLNIIHDQNKAPTTQQITQALLTSYSTFEFDSEIYQYLKPIITLLSNTLTTYILLTFHLSLKSIN